MRPIGRLLAMIILVGAGLIASREVQAQAGFPPPPAGMAPVGPGNPTQQHFEILRQQQIERRDFEQSQQRQRALTDRNLETLRRQQLDQRRIRDADRTAAIERERRITAEQGRQIQSRVPRNGRRAAETPARHERFPSILIEDSPRRRAACGQGARPARRCR